MVWPSGTDTLCKVHHRKCKSCQRECDTNLCLPSHRLFYVFNLWFVQSDLDGAKFAYWNARIVEAPCWASNLRLRTTRRRIELVVVAAEYSNILRQMPTTISILTNYRYSLHASILWLLPNRSHFYFFNNLLLIEIATQNDYFKFHRRRFGVSLSITKWKSTALLHSCCDIIAEDAALGERRSCERSDDFR